MAKESIDNIVRCWEISGAAGQYEGATAQQLEDAQHRLGRRFPDEFTALYERCNGAEVLDGNLQLYPLDGQELSVLHASEFLRAADWPIPSELVVLAGDGQGAVFGLWLPENAGGRALVVEVGQIFEEGSLSVTGTSLSGFLRGRTAYYLLLLEAPAAAVERLGLPKGLRTKEADGLDDSDYEAFLRWANPDLPDHAVSSYEARLTPGEVRRLARLSG
jgi:hypothetical protein